MFDKAILFPEYLIFSISFVLAYLSFRISKWYETYKHTEEIACFFRYIMILGSVSFMAILCMGISKFYFLEFKSFELYQKIILAFFSIISIIELIVLERNLDKFLQLFKPIKKYSGSTIKWFIVYSILCVVAFPIMSLILWVIIKRNLLCNLPFFRKYKSYMGE